jgi:hypothetical protein
VHIPRFGNEAKRMENYAHFQMTYSYYYSQYDLMLCTYYITLEHVALVAVQVAKIKGLAIE